jgi:predicted nucleic acid-binding protein
MAVVIDTSIVVALLSEADHEHDAAVDLVARLDDDLVTTPLAVSEMNYFAARYGGPEAAQGLWDDFESGALAVRWWADALAETIALARRNPPIGLVDASLVALAARLNTQRIATLDHHRFRSLTTVAGDPFVLLPADAS